MSASDRRDPPPASPAERRPRWGDWAAVAALLALGWLAIFLNHQYPDESIFDGALPPWGDYLALALLVTPVLVRRIAPIAVCVVVGVGFAPFRLLEVPEGQASTIAVLLVLHAAGAWGPASPARTWARAAATAAGAVALVVGLGRDMELVTVDDGIALTFAIVQNIGFYALAWLLGEAGWRQRADRAELARRAEELAAEREKVAEQAVTEERVRIARELHDVVAHHVSVMGVQAGAARHVLARDPDRAAGALAHVEASGREAVAELQRLVAILRSEVDEGVEGPQPTLEDLDRLVEGWRDAGMAVEVRRIGRPRPVPSAIALSAYRIIQEGLTNAFRHAPGSAVTVVVTHLAEVVQVEVVNGPGDAPGEGPGGGRGLLGMRERVALLGGDLDAGRLPGGGFRVRARLPALPVRAPDTPAGVVA